MTERDTQNAPLEELLRAAMAARAEQVTVGALRPADPVSARGVNGRSRWMTVAVPLSVMATVAATFAAVSLMGAPDTNRSTPLQSQTPVPLPTGIVPTTTTPTPDIVPPGEASSGPTESSASSTSRPPSTNPAGGAASSTKPKSSDVSAVKFTKQSSWKVVRANAMKECVVAKADFAGDCTGYGVVAVRVKPVPDSAGTWPNAEHIDSDSDGLNQLTCMRDGKLVIELPPDQRAVTKLTAKSTVTVAGHAAKYRSWAATCEGIGSYTIRLWYLTEQGVYVTAIGLPADDTIADRVVATMDLSGFKPLPD